MPSRNSPWLFVHFFFFLFLNFFTHIPGKCCQDWDHRELPKKEEEKKPISFSLFSYMFDYLPRGSTPWKTMRSWKWKKTTFLPRGFQSPRTLRWVRWDCERSNPWRTVIPILANKNLQTPAKKKKKHDHNQKTLAALSLCFWQHPSPEFMRSPVSAAVKWPHLFLPPCSPSGWERAWTAPPHPSQMPLPLLPWPPPQLLPPPRRPL